MHYIFATKFVCSFFQWCLYSEIIEVEKENKNGRENKLQMIFFSNRHAKDILFIW